MLMSFSANSFPADYVPTVFDNYVRSLLHYSRVTVAHIYEIPCICATYSDSESSFACFFAAPLGKHLPHVHSILVRPLLAVLSLPQNTAIMVDDTPYNLGLWDTAGASKSSIFNDFSICWPID